MTTQILENNEFNEAMPSEVVMNPVSYETIVEPNRDADVTVISAQLDIDEAAMTEETTIQEEFVEPIIDVNGEIANVAPVLIGADIQGNSAKEENNSIVDETLDVGIEAVTIEGESNMLNVALDVDIQEELVQVSTTEEADIQRELVEPAITEEIVNMAPVLIDTDIQENFVKEENNNTVDEALDAGEEVLSQAEDIVIDDVLDTSEICLGMDNSENISSNDELESSKVILELNIQEELSNEEAIVLSDILVDSDSISGLDVQSENVSEVPTDTSFVDYIWSFFYNPFATSSFDDMSSIEVDV